MDKNLTDSDKKLEELIYSKKFSLIKKRINSADLLFYLVNKIKSLNARGLTVIQIIGGAASGKTTLARNLSAKLGNSDYFGTDDFLIGDREYRRKHIEGGDPTSKYDADYLNAKIREIRNLRDNGLVAVPTYNEKTGVAISEGEENYKHRVGKVDFIIIEGDFNFAENCDLTIYFHVPDAIRLRNRIRRDQKKRSASKSEIEDNFNLRQKLQHIPYTLVNMEISDLIVAVLADKNKISVNYSYNIYGRSNQI